MRRAEEMPLDPRLLPFVEALAEALAAEYFRQLAAEKQQPQDEEAKE
jgi:hypothetical protein